MRLADYMTRFPDFERGTAPGAEPFRLDRTRYLLEALGHPERRYRIVHIGGTKGKGSTATMIASILGAANLRVGLYTSPHVRSINERIAIDRVPADDETLGDVMASRIDPAVGRLPAAMGQPTAFEILTLLALTAFAEAAVDVAAIEVGLGGTLDATNVIDRPEVVVLTPISLDHVQILGQTVEQIARDKAGIIKPGTAVVVAPQIDEARRPIYERASGVGASVFQVEDHVQVRRHAVHGGSQQIGLQGSGFDVDAVLRVAGAHQATNAACAALACALMLTPSIPRPAATERALAHRLWHSARSGDDSGGHPSRTQLRHGSSHPRTPPAEAIKRGLETVTIPGRFQRVPHPHGTIVVDVAHNEASARALHATVLEALAERVTYVVGMSEDKNEDTFLRELAPSAARFVLVRSAHPRSMSTTRLRTAAEATGVPAVEAGDSDAGLAIALGGENPPAVVITGSFYTVSEALNLLDPDYLRT